MANHLHEIAAIIGTASADRDLLPVFQKFLSDAGRVQYGLLKHLYDFCKVNFGCKTKLERDLWFPDRKRGINEVIISTSIIQYPEEKTLGKYNR